MGQSRKADRPEVVADEALDGAAGGGALARIQESVEAQSDQKTVLNSLLTSIVGNSGPTGR